MKRPSRRLCAVSGAATAAVFLLAGCNTNPGAAAVVGGQSVSTDQLRGVYQRALTTTCGQQYAAQPLVLQRLELTNLVLDRLLTQLGDRLGVTVSDADVNTQIATLSDQFGFRKGLEQQLSAGSAVSPQDLPLGVRQQLLTQRIEDALTRNIKLTDEQLRDYYDQNEQNYLAGHARAIVVGDQQTAESLAARLKANPQSFQQLLDQTVAQQRKQGKVFADPESLRRGGAIGLLPLGGLKANGYPTTPGSIFAVQGPNGWYVLDIVDNQSFSDVRQQVRRDMLAQQRQAALSKALDAQLKRTSISVNPRFGRWDAAQHVVAPSTRGPVAVAKQEFATSLQCQQQG